MEVENAGGAGLGSVKFDVLARRARQLIVKRHDYSVVRLIKPL